MGSGQLGQGSDPHFSGKNGGRGGGGACQMVPSLDCRIDVRETQRLMPSCNDTAVAIASEVKNRQLHSPGFEQYKCGPKKLKLKEDADFENIQT